jgi:antitoxin HicB
MIVVVEGHRRMDKNVEYYMDLPYTIELIRDKEAGWFVRVKELRGCMSQGDTAEEALVMIQDAMRAWLEVAIEDSIPIPEPLPDEEYSGKFVVRVPRSLHRQLVEQAEREDVSLNQYINVTLARAVGQQSAAPQPAPVNDVSWSALKAGVLAVAESQPQYKTGAGLPRAEATRLVKDIEKQMKEAVKALDFEKAALLRNQIVELGRSA